MLNYEEALVFLLKFFVAFQGSLVIRIDDDKEQIALCLGVNKVLKAAFVYGVEIPGDNDCFGFMYEV